MSSIIREHALVALAAAEQDNPEQFHFPPKKGDLQGKKVIPLEFYLHVGGAVIGGVAAVALTVAALWFSVFTLLAAAAACVLLCFTNTLAASFIRQLTPEQEVDSIIVRLYTKVYDLLKINKEIKNNPIIKNGLIIKQEPVLEKDIANLKVKLAKQVNLLTQHKKITFEFAKKQNSELEKLQDYINIMENFFRDNGEDTSNLIEIRNVIKNQNLEDLDTPKRFFETILQNHQGVYKQFSEVLRILESYTKHFNEDYHELKNQLKIAQNEKAAIEAELQEKKNELAEVNNLIQSKA